MSLIYLDNNASTRPAPEVTHAMQPWLGERYGNPSSTHAAGQAARRAVENARAAVAALLGARPREIVFTATGTEANNLAILGAVAAQPHKRRLVSTPVEHDSVLRPLQRLERHGCTVTWLPVDSAGRLDPDEFAAALTDDTALASVMHANNETGVIFPVERLARIAADRGVLFHVDAVQSAGKLPIDLAATPISLLTISAHKMHGPQGAAALFVRRGVHLVGPFSGGHQERDLRPGTENVAAIVGFGVAAELAQSAAQEAHDRIARLRDRLEAGLLERVPFARVNGTRDARLCNTTNIGFASLEAEAVVVLLSENGICASAGAACASGSLEPSHVLKAMGIDPALAHGGVRFSLSRDTTQSEIDAAIERIPPLIHRLARLLPQAAGTRQPAGA